MLQVSHCWSAEATNSASRKPNVVLIIFDTLRADVLGSHGYDADTSPELDKIARRGVRMDRAISQSSWTRPSIGSMLTSRYPRSLGLYEEQGEILSDGAVTLAEILKQYGYTTIGVTANPTINSAFNMDQGFDKYVDSHVVYSWMGVKKGELDARSRKLMAARELFRIAEELVDASDAESPFYVQICAMEMHEYARRKHHLIRNRYLKAFGEEPLRVRRRYLQSLKQLSLDTEQFVNRLLLREDWENTLFTFVGDHGEGLDSHPSVSSSQFHGTHLYESLVHVPWILYSPTWNPVRHTIDRAVQLLDVLPTVLDFVDVPIPAGLEGVSLIPAISGKEPLSQLPEHIIAETEFRNFSKKAVYGPDWYYIESEDNHPGTDSHELQRIGGAADGRRTNKFKDHPEVVATLKSFLKNWDAQHPKASPTPQTGELSDAVKEQLKSIGYLK